MPEIMGLVKSRDPDQKEFQQTRGEVWRSVDPALDHNPRWYHKADCAFPSATQNKINGVDAKNLLKNGVQLVAEAIMDQGIV